MCRRPECAALCVQCWDSLRWLEALGSLVLAATSWIQQWGFLPKIEQHQEKQKVLQTQWPESRTCLQEHLPYSSLSLWPSCLLCTFELKASDMHYVSVWNLSQAALTHQFLNNLYMDLILSSTFPRSYYLGNHTTPQLLHGYSSLTRKNLQIICISIN